MKKARLVMSDQAGFRPPMDTLASGPQRERDGPQIVNIPRTGDFVKPVGQICPMGRVNAAKRRTGSIDTAPYNGQTGG